MYFVTEHEVSKGTFFRCENFCDQRKSLENGFSILMKLYWFFFTDLLLNEFHEALNKKNISIDFCCCNLTKLNFECLHFSKLFKYFSVKNGIKS